MDTQVIADISDTDAQDSAQGCDHPADRDTERADRLVRRFTFDPATSPALMTALAWNAAGPRR